MPQINLFILLQQDIGLFSNVEKAGIIGLLITAIIYFVREKIRTDKEIAVERENRLKEMKENAIQMGQLLEKVIESGSKNIKETYTIIDTHEKNVIAILKEQIDRIEEQIKNISNANK